MTSAQMRERLLQFALDVFQLTKLTPDSWQARHACLARSRAEFAAKLGLVREEADETAFWFEFARRADLWSATDRLQRIEAEAAEISAMIRAAYRTVRAQRS